MNLSKATAKKTCSCFLTDQFEKVKKYYRESVKAEQKCNASVSGPFSPVEQSKETRTLTEDLLDASKDKFLRALAAQNKSLNELQQKAHDLDKKVHHLSHRVGSVAGFIIIIIVSFIYPCDSHKKIGFAHLYWVCVSSMYYSLNL